MQLVRHPQSRVVEVPSADVLYSNGLRDATRGKYDPARKEFQDYLKYYDDTALASNARFYLREIAYSQANYRDAVNECSRLVMDYPRSLRIVSARYKKGSRLSNWAKRTPVSAELRVVTRRYPGTEQEHRARAKLQELSTVPRKKDYPCALALIKHVGMRDPAVTKDGQDNPNAGRGLFLALRARALHHRQTGKAPMRVDLARSSPGWDYWPGR